MAVAPAHATEFIRDYAVQANIMSDGMVDITETIIVNAENIKINRGIYRDFPTQYVESNGRNVDVLFAIKDISRNGKKEDYHTTSLNNGIRIYIGNQDHYVPIGEHVYKIHYKVKRVIGFFDDYDEFYWNVTGNGWDFPIHRASLLVNLPNGAHVVQAKGYTGPQGSQLEHYKHQFNQSQYYAETTYPLNPREGFTVAVAFPKGFVTPRDNIDNLIDFLKFHLAWFTFLLTTISLLGYNFIMWYRKGRDVSGTIIPRFDIPDGVSPDMLRYVVRQGYDNKVFSCLLVQAAVKGLLRIEDNETATVLTSVKNENHTAAQDDSLKIITTMLTQKGGAISIPKPGIFAALSQQEWRRDLALFMQRGLADHHRSLNHSKDFYFESNLWIKLRPFLITIVSLLLVWLVSNNSSETRLVQIVMVFSHLAIIGLFWGPFTKYTFEGQKTADYAAGLKLYLTVAEEAQLNELYPKTVTPEKFEHLLPYALALDVEQEWCEYFSDLVAAGLVRYDNNGNNDWYRSYQSKGLVHIGDTLGRHLTSTISSASTPPGSSSGSRGSGRSGGGGGGGGGGGW